MAFVTGTPLMLLGDKTEGIVGTRQDIEVTMLDQAVIQDNTGAIIYNLAQQEMVAVKLVMRGAWEVANTINWLQQTESARSPVCGSRLCVNALEFRTVRGLMRE